MTEDNYLAYIYVRRLDDGSEVSKIGLSSVDPRYVDRVLAGLIRQIDRELYYADDSEIDRVAKKSKGN